MSHSRKDLPQSQIELTITVTPDEYQKHLGRAAERISERTKIQGFRPGKAPFDLVKRQVGEMAIMQEALEPVVKETYYAVVTAEKLDVIGMPQINVQKMAPGNDIIYTATVALLPKITLADIKKIKVKHEAKPTTDDSVDEVLTNLRKMQAKEVLKADAAAGATAEDIVMVDMDMFFDTVPVDGGQAKNYRVYLSEDHYIPGFNKELVGIKKDEERNFSVNFPSTHYQKHLAGKKVAVKVKAKDIYDRQMPELDENFAKSLGQDSIEKLRDLLRVNLTKEADQKADQKVEIEILDTLVEKSTFDEIPEVLIDAERRKMFYELTRDLERNGVTIEQYLKDIKKTEAALFEDFKAQAIKRAKAALLSRQIAREQNLVVSEEEIDAELKLMAETYRDTPEYLEQLKEPQVRDTVRTILQNKKVVAWLKEQVLGV